MTLMHDIDDLFRPHNVLASWPNHQGLWHLAADSGGYFTTAQAQSYHITRRLLAYHTRRGRYRRIGQGLYRLRDFSSLSHDDVRAGWLSVGAEQAQKCVCCYRAIRIGTTLCYLQRE